MADSNFNVDIDAQQVLVQYEHEQFVPKKVKPTFDTKNYLQARLSPRRGN